LQDFQDDENVPDFYFIFIGSKFHKDTQFFNSVLSLSLSLSLTHTHTPHVTRSLFTLTSWDILKEFFSEKGKKEPGQIF
jgi:hypothetical protein